MSGGTLMPGGAPLADHPLANLFPLLSDTELNELAVDIAENGQAETIKLHRGMILDGRNRYRACALKGLAVRYEVFSGTDREALNWVISKNLRRRHLNESQRAMVARKLATLKLGSNQHTAAPIGAPSLPGMSDDAPAALVSQGEAADILSVGRRSVQRAAVVLEKGAPELQAAVESGKVAVSTAADIAETTSKEEQTKIVGLSQNDILEAAKKIRKERNEKRREERVEKLKTQSENSKSLPTGQKFSVIYMDPPTKFAAGDSDRSTENHYLTLDEDELSRLPINDLALASATLYIWTTVPWLRKTLRLIEGWGFSYVSEICWNKEVQSLGFWNRNQHESLLICTRGDPDVPKEGVRAPSIYTERRGKHSAKPDYFRNLISLYHPDLQKVELFPRIDGPMPEDWFAWGNEARVPKQQQLGMESPTEGDRDSDAAGSPSRDSESSEAEEPAQEAAE